MLDLTAGWGADSLTLAHHGQRVTLIEHDELIYALLAHSLACLASDPSGAEIAQRMSLRHTGASEFLRGLEAADRYDCIYLDPMFPAHKSGARPAKEMQILQALANNQDIEICFRLAREKARRRVVV